MESVLEEGVCKCKPFEDVSDFIKSFGGTLTARMLEAEMESHLGYKKIDKMIAAAAIAGYPYVQLKYVIVRKEQFGRKKTKEISD